MALAAYDLSQPGSSTLSAPFCVMTSLPHCNRNAGSCTDGYTTASGSREREIKGIVAVSQYSNKLFSEKKSSG